VGNRIFVLTKDQHPVIKTLDDAYRTDSPDVHNAVLLKATDRAKGVGDLRDLFKRRNRELFQQRSDQDPSECLVIKGAFPGTHRLNPSAKIPSPVS
jgi:hypothetical protein